LFRHTDVTIYVTVVKDTGVKSSVAPSSAAKYTTLSVADVTANAASDDVPSHMTRVKFTSTRHLAVHFNLNKSLFVKEFCQKEAADPIGGRVNMCAGDVVIEESLNSRVVSPNEVALFHSHDTVAILPIEVADHISIELTFTESNMEFTTELLVIQTVPAARSKSLTDIVLSFAPSVSKR